MFDNRNLNGIDLHIHTTNSDGKRSLENTIRDAQAEHLRAIAITDHNQFSITKPVEDSGLEIIPGAEFSSSYTIENRKQIEIHLVGLFFNGVNQKVQHIFDSLSKQREQYIKAILAQLGRLGMKLSYQELKETYQVTRQMGRRHVAESMLKKGYVSSIDEAFDCYIGNRSQYLIEVTDFIQYMPMQESVELICRNEGFPILAHPYHYGFHDPGIEKLVSDFKDAAKGYAAGIEVYYAKYQDEQRKNLLRLAKQYQLLPSAGSDSHCKEEQFTKAPYDILQAIKNAAISGS